MASEKAEDAIRLAALCGLELDDWQQHVLRRGLGVRGDGLWSASHVGLVVARQNGKGATLLARELAGAILFGERLIIHSAHEAETARNHMQEWLDLIDGSSMLASKVAKTPMGRGSEAIEFKNGARVRFRTRTRGGGRGLSADLVVVDEAFEYSVDAMSALEPTTSSAPNPQIWLASSAVDQVSHPNGVVLSRRRHAALSDDPGRLCWLEWSPEDGYDPGDRDVWAATNPALGIRITEEHVEGEWSAMPSRMFAVERLSDGDWPPVDGKQKVDDRALTAEAWSSARDRSVKPEDPVCFGVGVSPDRRWSSIVAAGWTGDGRVAVELVDRRRNVGWVRDRAAQLEEHGPSGWVVDGFASLDDLDVRVLSVTSSGDLADSFKRFVDAVNDGSLSHLGQDELDAAVASHKTTRNLMVRSDDGGDVSALIGASLAVWGLSRAGAAPDPFVFVS